MKRVGFCGAGQMATALAAGCVSAGVMSADSISAFDPSAEACQKFKATIPGVSILTSCQELTECDAVVLAIKPQYLTTAILPLQGRLGETLVVSIVTGVSIAKLKELLGECRVIRVMPNTPCLVKTGACGIAADKGAADKGATDDDLHTVQRWLEALGVAHVVPESLLDAVTGLSGSGPAYVYQVIEALSDGGVLMGLPRAMATELAAQTVKGAAEMVLQTGLHPAELKDRVASPGGTTIAAIEALENHGLRAALIAAVRASAERSMELGREH
jgi:pyrroline-5-carboxylate reductase